jgi:dihydrofolate reductase
VRIRLPSISYIVARSSPDGIIGRNNGLPWHLRTDLQRFKSITLGHVVIMGRRTYLSIGRALPGRTNVVLSRNRSAELARSFWHREETTLLWAENRESALFFADVVSITNERPDFFVIGGSEMYRIFGDLFNKVYLTEVLTGGALHRKPGDAVFDYKIDNRKWRTIETKDVPAGPRDDYPSRFTVFERRVKHVRYVEVKDYYTETETKNLWLQNQLNLLDQAKAANPEKPVSLSYQYHLFEDQSQSA